MRSLSGQTLKKVIENETNPIRPTVLSNLMILNNAMRTAANAKNYVPYNTISKLKASLNENGMMNTNKTQNFLGALRTGGLLNTNGVLLSNAQSMYNSFNANKKQAISNATRKLNAALKAAAKGPNNSVPQQNSVNNKGNKYTFEQFIKEYNNTRFHLKKATNAITSIITAHQKHKQIYEHPLIQNSQKIQALETKTSLNNNDTKLILYVSFALSMPERFLTSDDLFNKFLKIEQVKKYYGSLNFRISKNGTNNKNTQNSIELIKKELDNFRDGLDPLDDTKSIQEFLYYTTGKAAGLIRNK